MLIYDEATQSFKEVPVTTDIIDINADGNTYFGEAVPGASTAAPLWQIQRKSVSGTSTSFKYAGGTGNYSQVWDNRTSLTYP